MVNKTKPTVVITRPEKQSAAFDAALKQAGYETFHLPSIVIQTCIKTSRSIQVLNKIEQGYFDWIVFTSANAVTSLIEMQGKTESLPIHTKIAVIGDKTAKVFKEYYGRDVNLVPKKFISELLIEQFKTIPLEGQKFLCVLAAKTRNIISPFLVQSGAEVSELIAYENVSIMPAKETVNTLLKMEFKNLIFTFFSPSAVYSTIEILKSQPDIFKHARVVSIGPITTKALSEHGISAALESSDHSEEGVLKVLQELH